MSTDPAGDVDGLNRYKMVGNNPIAYTDPSGQKKKKINKDIHMIWIGEAPEKLATQVTNINNTVKRASGYKVHLHLDTANKESYSTVLKQLKIHNTNYLRGSTLFNKFQKTEVAVIYNDFRSGDPSNLAFAADVLRPFIVRELGGMYSDVDDIYQKKNTKEEKKLGNTSFRADPDELITHEPMFMPWEGLIGLPQIPNSSFAAHPGNSVLTDVMKEMTLRYNTIVESGHYSNSTGYIGDGILEKEPDSRIGIMSGIVGPRVLTDVISRHDSEIEPMLNEQREIRFRAKSKSDQGFFDKMRAKMPLGLYIRPGNLHSWKK